MSLLVWLPLNGDLKNQGLSNAQFKVNNAVSTLTEGKIGSCYYLNGTALSSPNFSALQDATDYSACCWIKFTKFPDAGSNAYCICLNGSTASSYKFVLGVFSATSSDGTVASVRLNSKSSSGCNIYLNTWYHLAITVKGSSGNIYINGELKDTISGLSPVNSATNLIIGGRSSNANGTSFLGLGAPAYYNDVRIYNHCLTPREVKELSKGLMLHYNFEDTYLEGTTNLLPSSLQNANITSGGASYNISVSSGTAFTLSGYVTLYPDDVCTNPRMTIVVQFTDGTEKSASVSNQIKDGVERYAEVTYTVPSGKTPKAIRGWILDYSTAGVRHAKLRRMQIEAKDHATPYTSSTRTGEKCYDCSGHGMHGALTGSVKVCNEGLNGTKSIYLDGSSSGPYIITPNINLSDTMTYMVNAKIATAKNQFLIDHRVSNSGYQPFYVYSDGRVQIWGSGSSAGGTGTTIPSDGKYHQLAVVINAGTAYMYVDGVQKWSTALSAVSANNPITLGARHSKDTGTRFNGYLNDFKVYATALSASEIKKMYDTPIVINKNGTIITRGSIVE